MSVIESLKSRAGAHSSPARCRSSSCIGGDAARRAASRWCSRTSTSGSSSASLMVAVFFVVNDTCGRAIAPMIAPPLCVEAELGLDACPSAVSPRCSPRASPSRPRTRRGRRRRSPNIRRAGRPRRSSRCCGARRSRTTTGCRSRRSRRSPRCSTCPTSACSRSRPSTRCSTSRRSGAITSSSAARRRACCAAPRTSRRCCRKRIGEPGHVTADGKFSWIEVECLGACCNAPMVQINDDYYEDLTPENFAKLLDDLAAGRPVKTGSQTGRVSSEPVGGADGADDALRRRRTERQG